jgi:probable F420-dependent oxidoreductase
MKIGISTFVTGYAIRPAVLAQRVEALGFESFWVPEHPIIPVHTTTPFPGSADGIIPDHYATWLDPFVTLASAAAVTKTIKLGTGICLVPERNPLHLAKEVASLDHCSGGRFLLGIGAGWLKEETEIFGANYPRRWTWTRECVLALTELWTKDEAEFHGEFIHFPPVKSFPKPVQKPHPPVILGGMAKYVLKRVVAYGNGWMPNRVTPEQVKAGRTELDRLAIEAGRDPASLEISVFGQAPDPDLIKQFQDAGAARVTVRLMAMPEREALAELESIARQVLP